MRKVKVTFLPEEKEVWVYPGETLQDAFLRAGYWLETPCAGRGICGKCRVRVQEIRRVQERTSLELTSEEIKHLSPEEIQQGFRLACQTEVTGEMQVIVPPTLGDILRPAVKIQGVVEDNIYPLSPAVRKVYLELPAPSRNDRLADWERLERGLRAANYLPQGEIGGRGWQLDSALLCYLPEVLRKSNYKVTAVFYEDKLIGVETGNTSEQIYGLALDLGTTTMVGFLIDLKSGRQLAAAGRGNPQAVFGADVISRISYVSGGKSHLRELQSRLIEAVNLIITELVERSGINRNQIYEATAVGNTVIHHLFLGLDPTYLGQGPYVPVITRPLKIKARRLGIQICEGGYLYLLPNIAGFVGGDAVGVILSTGLYHGNGVRLAVDIGTNGEIILGWGREILACSTAAGPAFEGARIKKGMRAAVGAIEKVVIGEDVEVGVIGGGLPRGISGSGLIDAVAELLRIGIVDYTGRLLGREEVSDRVPRAVWKRIVEKGNHREFVLVFPEKTADGETISITQDDIRELQLAKGAIAAGIRILQKELGVETEQIEEVFLAGAFGSSINPLSARQLGLIPEVPLERVKAVGNAAGEGAKLTLLSRLARREAEEIAATVRYVELSGRADFQEAFLAAMYFPRGQ